MRRCSLCREEGHQRDKCDRHPFGGLYEHVQRPGVRITRRSYPRPTIDTHEMPAFAELWMRYRRLIPIDVGSIQAIDPFARNCQWAHPWTNDMNIDTLATEHLDAEDYLKQIERTNHRFGIVLLDPPFSDRQADEVYGTPNLYASDSGKIKRIGMMAGNILIPGGYIIKAGFNTNKPHPCVDLVEVSIVATGASRNDVLFSVWKKNQHTLTDMGVGQ